MSANDDDSKSKSQKNISFLSKVTRSLKNVFTIKPRSREELLWVLKDATNHEILTLEAFHMIEGVLQVSDMQVRDIMIPRSQMTVIDKDSTLDDILQLMIDSGHSRFPVVGTNRDEVLGTLLAKDLLPYIIKKDEELNIKKLVRPAMLIPESKRLNILLKEFRVKKQHMAIIADEYGGISGLVTIEDVLEQIVGDIEDEFDTDESSYITELTKNSHQVQALTPIEDFNEYFKSDFTDEEFDTFGGIVLNALGHLPKKNESVTINGYFVKVLSADKRRIRTLQVTKVENSSDDDSNDSD